MASDPKASGEHGRQHVSGYVGSVRYGLTSEMLNNHAPHHDDSVCGRAKMLCSFVAAQRVLQLLHNGGGSA